MRTVLVDQRSTSRTRIIAGMMPNIGGGMMSTGAGPSTGGDPRAATRDPRAPSFRSPDLRPDLSADQGPNEWIDCRKLNMTLSEVLKIIRREN